MGSFALVLTTLLLKLTAPGAEAFLTTSQTPTNFASIRRQDRFQSSIDAKSWHLLTGLKLQRQGDAETTSELQEEQYIEIAYEDYFDGTRPDSSWNLARVNFMRQGKTILTQLAENLGLRESDPLKPPACLQLTLSNKAVKETEDRRIAAGDGVDAHPISLALYDFGCALLDTLFDERPIPRFWFLEIIARIPYFSYVSMLHLYESFGWWRAVELRKVHAAEEWNELHHLLIMESLGGNSLWSDRFLGYHAAFFYYWALIAVFLCSPRIAYEFMELLEAHAVDTYGTFCRENRSRLAQLPPPQVAESYYKTGDLYLFDDFQVSRTPGTRRPPCETLLDVFENICTDEGEHVKTMRACQNYAQGGAAVVSPHLASSSGKVTDPEKKRQLWKEWSEMVNEERAESVDSEGTSETANKTF